MFVKICGITQVRQGVDIAQMMLAAQFRDRCGLGFICYPPSKRFVSCDRIRAIVSALPQGVETVGVFVDESMAAIADCVRLAQLGSVQLHGAESPEYCLHLRESIPNIRLIKALRLRQKQDLQQLDRYKDCADMFLIDAYHPQQMGGTGSTADWSLLQGFDPGKPWLLAGGLTPTNALEALSTVRPDGIDLSSGVEVQPGIKDLALVRQLLRALNSLKV